MNRNGKDIVCKTCGKKFYTSQSRFSFKKYCSRDCAFKDNLGFKPREKQCIICGSSFVIRKNIEVQKKTCSYECHYKNAIRISKKRSAEKVERKCKKCGKNFIIRKLSISTICNPCHYKSYSKERIGKGNPNFRGGVWSRNGYYKKGSKAVTKHMNACQNYRRDFLRKHDYLFCENCNKNNAFKFDSHHIIFASEKSGHKELHNFKNMILLCRDCHTNFHRHKYLRNNLILDRGLVELFKDKSIIRDATGVSK